MRLQSWKMWAFITVLVTCSSMLQPVFADPPPLLPGTDQSVVGPIDPNKIGDYNFCSYKNKAGRTRCEPISSPELYPDGLTFIAADKYCLPICDPAKGEFTECTPVQDCAEDQVSQPVELVNPIGNTDISSIVGSVVKKILGVVGAITLAVFVYGAFLWITSAGNEEKVREGAAAMFYAVLGIFIIFASYGILSLVFTKLAGQ